MARSPVSDADALPDVNIGRVSTSVKHGKTPTEVGAVAVLDGQAAISTMVSADSGRPYTLPSEVRRARTGNFRARGRSPSMM